MNLTVQLDLSKYEFNGIAPILFDNSEEAKDWLDANAHKLVGYSVEQKNTMHETLNNVNYPLIVYASEAESGWGQPGMEFRYIEIK